MHGVPPPDSWLPPGALSRDAYAAVAPLLTPGLMNHTARTFLLGSAWARKKGVSFDPEDFCVAALFHDLGLVSEKRRGEPFTVASASALESFLRDRSVPAERVAPLADAILLHMQLFPRFSRGPVAGLLQIGAWMDVTFLRRPTIWGEARKIAKAFPGRIDFEFMKLLGATLTSPGACLGLLSPRPRRLPPP